MANTMPSNVKLSHQEEIIILLLKQYIEDGKKLVEIYRKREVG